MLKLQFSDNHREPVWVVEKLFTIGSQPGNHLVLTHPSVEPVHARLIQENNRFYLKDNNSKSGCFVNEQRVTHKEIVPGDRIRLGTIQIQVLEPGADISGEDENLQWQLVSDNSLLANTSFTLPNDRPVIVGRDNQCDIVLAATYLSRQHTRLEVAGDKVKVTDLSSANGTFINEQPVDSYWASAGDRLRVDIYTFRLVAPDPDAISRARLRATIQSLAKPVERKQADTNPKRWKTRPTSPGNRVETPLPRRPAIAIKWAVIAALAVLVTALVILWFGR